MRSRPRGGEPLLFKGLDFIHTDLVAADLPNR
ncbi:type II toxin-antitoxin system VapC family toxin [Frankia sp. ArI3]|nr:type II toxin-antitoxin system VapC family toxin [Frankia sp. ArI3]